MSKANVKGDNRGWKRLRGDRSSLWSRPAPLETVGEPLYQLPEGSVYLALSQESCAPVFRPFVRYVRARMTGQDPHHILRPYQTRQTWHSSWYSRFWRSKSSAKEGTKHAQGSKFRPPAENKSPKTTKGGDACNETDVTISLPIQGVQERQDSMTMMPPARTLEMFNSGSTLGSEMSADRNEKERNMV
ncbi:MAG: hypothetical protein Q9204_003170 [Flavoplaca sp. TL-2023a]